MRQRRRRQPRAEPRVRSQTRVPRTARSRDLGHETPSTEDQWRPQESELLKELGEFIKGCAYGNSFVDCARVQRRARA